MNLNDMSKECIEDSNKWFPKKAYDVPFLTLALAGEVGELANMVKKIERGTHKYSILKDEMAMELIDVQIYLCNLYAVFNIDAEELYRQKREFNARRFGSQPTADGC